jgi:predicted ribosome quality control (RQC) complex YloA/Tae2 family protein
VTSGWLQSSERGHWSALTNLRIMTMAERHGPPGPTDPDQGIWAGRRVARRFESPDGFVILVGKTAEDNDVLTFKLGSPRDFWLHVAAESGSHVVVRNPDNLADLPRETVRYAAALAARYSKARHGGRVAVHVARCADVGKPCGFAPGKVTLDRYRTVQVAPAKDE